VLYSSSDLSNDTGLLQKQEEISNGSRHIVLNPILIEDVRFVNLPSRKKDL